MKYTTNMPEIMANWLTETKRPRLCAGEISAMYIGNVIRRRGSQPANDPKDDKYHLVARQRRAQRRNQKQQCGDGQHLLPAESIAQQAGKRGAQAQPTKAEDATRPSGRAPARNRFPETRWPRK